MNPANPSLTKMVEITKNGYSRKMASDLYALVQTSPPNTIS